VKGLARDGARWPSGARSTQPLADGQVWGRILTAGGRRIAKAQSRQDADKSALSFGISLRLCVSAGSAVEFGAGSRSD